MERETQRRLERINLAVLAVSAVCLVLALFWYAADTQPGTLHRWWAVVITAAAVLITAGFAIVRPFTLTHHRTVAASVLASVVLAAGVGVTWAMVSSDNGAEPIEGQRVGSAEAAGAYQDTHHSDGKRRIPTGVMVQQMKFGGANEVDVSGYVWQRFTADVPAAARGVIFPEAENSYSLTDAYTYKHGDGSETVGWYFQAKLRQSFDYRHYPLDRQNVWLQLWTKDNTQQTSLVPDFSSYPPWRDSKMYGISPDLVHADWRPYFSTWSYVQHAHTSTLGSNAAAYANPGVWSDLYFNIGTKRAWVGPMIDSLIRSLIVAVISFLALFLYTKADDDRRSAFGFSTWGAITFTMSTLLVIVVDQTQVRSATGGGMLTYLECFAYVMYAVILGVSVNAVLLTARREVRPVEWAGNRLPKLLYWPALLGLLLIVTLLYFSDYP
ncbi:hypothetical protein [Streptomyces sp. NBC_01465]|uniref:hypothetical protein n=1 Tax=Streptomyces sp. NBC_01465 TaxID=2903878 RepID=UPI002E35C8A4|nr:hypothetical protein [Streptomyces sp. NBC_01465]